MPIGRRTRRGLTLVEIMVSLGVSSIVTAAAAGVYYFAISQWNTGAADVDAFVSASLGAERMCLDIERARYATIWTQADGREVLRIGVIPVALETLGVDYFPDPGKSGYNPGTPEEYWFYISDNTGNPAVGGDILWRAHKPAYASATGDTTWSLQPETGRGRVSGVTYLDFSVYSDDNLVYVRLEVEGVEGQEQQPRRINRWAHMRNHD